MTTTNLDTVLALDVAAPMAQVRAALAWVLPAVSADRYGPPMLQSVRVELSAPGVALPDLDGEFRTVVPGGKDTVSVLTFAATDRYRLHWATIPLATKHAPALALLSASELSGAMRGWGKLTRQLPHGSVSLLSTGDTVSVGWSLKVHPDASPAVSGSASVPTVDAEFPTLGRIIGEGAAELERAPYVMFAGKYLADLGKAATAVSDGGHIEFRPTIRPYADRPTNPGPCFVRVPTAEPGNPTFGALLMPVRRP